MSEENLNAKIEELTKEIENLKFEKTKYWVELGKWFIVSVAFVLVSTILDFNFKNRDENIKEVQEYQKFVTELIILNENIAPRRLLAQYFSQVLPDDKQRSYWLNYYNILDKEYNSKIVENKNISTSLKNLEVKSNLTSKEKYEKEYLKNMYENNISELKSDFKIPESLKNENNLLNKEKVK